MSTWHTTWLKMLSLYLKVARVEAENIGRGKCVARYETMRYIIYRLS